MLEGLTDGLKSAFSFIERGRLSESNIREGMRQVRRALLEADVNLEVSQEFVARVTEQSLGEDVLKSIKPGEQIVGIVHNELERSPLPPADGRWRPEQPRSATGPWLTGCKSNSHDLSASARIIALLSSRLATGFRSSFRS